MSKKLTYVLITHTALHKARTGNILARLLSRSGLDLLAGRILNPSNKLSEGLAASFSSQTLTADYLRDKMTGAHTLALLFYGDDAVAKIASIVGDDETMNGRGETLRDSYGDLVRKGNEVVYFEPGVIAPLNEEQSVKGLSLLAEFSETDGGILDASESFPAGTPLEKTLVLIKPDNFHFPNMRPGGVMDLFARTGLALVGFKVHHMSVAQAKEFYGPVLDVLVAKLPDGHAHWESIISFMAGARPSECPEEHHALPGSKCCIALIYQGIDAVAKIREALGATNPEKACHGTIRKEFGQDIMVNAAHASDALESVVRETAIINIDENNFKSVILSKVDFEK
ncbi:MAG TPA: nucleoside-diphosphate kinase [Chthoniobacterales bacterium]|nr:nucleoside-diphosphate kinase [Chthoniobacterales bacterium]